MLRSASRGRYFDIEAHVPYRQAIGPYIQDVWAFTHYFLELRGASGDALSVSQLGAIRKAQLELLQSLPSEIYQVQFSYSTSGDYKEEAVEHATYQSAEIPLANYLREQRSARLVDDCQQRKIIRPCALLALSCAPPDSAFYSAGANIKRDKLRLIRRIPDKDMTLRASELLLISRTIVAETLGRAGISVKPWAPADLADYLYRLFNPSLAQDIPVNFDPERTPFNDAWLRQSWTLEDDCWRIGAGPYESFHGFVSMDEEPQESIPGIIAAITTKSSVRNIRVVSNIRRVDRIQEQDELRSKLQKTLMAMRDTTTIYDKIFDPHRRSDPSLAQYNVHEDETAQSIREVLKKSIVGASFTVVAQLIVHTWADTKKDLDLNRRLLLSQMSGMGSAAGVIESFPTYFITNSSLPGSVEQQFRARKMLAEMAADLTPIDCGLIGHDDPVCLFKTAAGALFPLDLWSKADVTAPMSLVMGGTGTGKSFLVNQLVMQHLVGDPVVVILDIGGSYRRQTELLGGTSISFDPAKPFCFNPFQVYGVNPDGSLKNPTPGERAKIGACIEALAVPPEDGNALLPVEMINAIDTAIEQTFHKAVSNQKRLVTLSDFYQHLLQIPGPGTELATRISPFLKRKQYGAWIDGPTDVDLTGKFLNIDLKGIKKDRRLCAAMIPILMNYIEDVLIRNPARRKIVVMDELWELITNERIVGFVVGAWKTYRKEGAALIGSTQSLGGDIADTPIADALIGNTHTWFLLNQGVKDHFEKASQVLDLTEGQRTILSNTKFKASLNARGEMENYRSCLLIRGANSTSSLSGEVLIEATPVEYWLCTTDPDEIQLFNRTRKSFDDDLLRSVEYLAGKYPYGLAAQKQIDLDRKHTLVLPE